MKVHNAKTWTLIEGECLRVLKKFSANRFDSIVTDPPYELGFMGKKWDGTGIAFSVALWAEVLRVLKPGGYVLAFGGTRCAHRMVCAIEDAGFEVRDSIQWIYGTGFPKSLNVGEGRGTALKPAHEPICLARKPVIGTVAQNVSTYGTGGLNIDATRIAAGDSDSTGRKNSGGKGNGGVFGDSVKYDSESSPLGRWPANVILDPGAAAELDAQSGTLKSGSMKAGTYAGRKSAVYSPDAGRPLETDIVSSTGGASRFFYVAKPSRSERDQGCEALPEKSGGEATDREDDSIGTQNPRAGAGRTGGAKNYHPTVKPITLMRYLVRMVTPIGGAVLDPFTGSGTTGIAAVLEGRGFVGVEREPEYFEIAKSRLSSVQIPDSKESK